MPDIIEQYEASLAILRREHTQDQWDRLQEHIVKHNEKYKWLDTEFNRVSVDYKETITMFENEITGLTVTINNLEDELTALKNAPQTS